MRAAADDGEILSSLSKIYKLSKPLTSPVVAALTTLSAVDAEELDFLKTGFVVDDFILVDSGTNQELFQIDSIPSGTEALPIKVPALLAHALDAAVVKLEKIDQGYIEEGSASFSGSSSTPSVGAANAVGKIWQGSPDLGDLGISWGQRASSLEVILSAYGINESLMKGDGTAGNPYRALVHPSVIATQRDYAYLLQGLHKNGATLNVALLNPTPTININAAFGAKNAPAVWTVGCVFTHKQVWIS